MKRRVWNVLISGLKLVFRAILLESHQTHLFSFSNRTKDSSLVLLRASSQVFLRVFLRRALDWRRRSFILNGKQRFSYSITIINPTSSGELFSFFFSPDNQTLATHCVFGILNSNIKLKNNVGHWEKRQYYYCEIWLQFNFYCSNNNYWFKDDCEIQCCSGCQLSIKLILILPRWFFDPWNSFDKEHLIYKWNWVLALNFSFDLLDTEPNWNFDSFFFLFWVLFWLLKMCFQMSTWVGNMMFWGRKGYFSI